MLLLEKKFLRTFPKKLFLVAAQFSTGGKTKNSTAPLHKVQTSPGEIELRIYKTKMKIEEQKFWCRHKQKFC